MGYITQVRFWPIIFLRHVLCLWAASGRLAALRFPGPLYLCGRLAALPGPPWAAHSRSSVPLLALPAVLHLVNHGLARNPRIPLSINWMNLNRVNRTGVLRRINRATASGTWLEEQDVWAQRAGQAQAQAIRPPGGAGRSGYSCSLRDPCWNDTVLGGGRPTDLPGYDRFDLSTGGCMQAWLISPAMLARPRVHRFHRASLSVCAQHGAPGRRPCQHH